MCAYTIVFEAFWKSFLGKTFKVFLPLFQERYAFINFLEKTESNESITK